MSEEGKKRWYPEWAKKMEDRYPDAADEAQRAAIAADAALHERLLRMPEPGVSDGARLLGAVDEHIQELEEQLQRTRERNEALTIGLEEMRAQRNEEAAAALLATEDRDRALMALDDAVALLDPAPGEPRAPAHERVKRALACLTPFEYD